MRRKAKWQPKLIAAVLAVGLAALPVQSSLSQAYADSKAAEAVPEETEEEPEKESSYKTEETGKDNTNKVESGEGKLDEENQNTGSNTGDKSETGEKDPSSSDGETEGKEETEEEKEESSSEAGDKDETEGSKEESSTEEETEESTEPETEGSTEESSESESKADTEESTEAGPEDSKDETEETVESSEEEVEQETTVSNDKKPEVQKLEEVKKLVEEETEKQIEDPVAMIGEQGYETLQEAVNAAEDDAIVTLMKDTQENIKVPEGKVFTLDLNGKTLNGGTKTGKEGYAAIENYGIITITDEVGGGTIKRDDHNVGGYYVIDNQGDMTFEGGSVENDSGIGENGSSLIRNIGTKEKEAVLTINDGNFRQSNFNVIKNDDLGYLYIDGGMISSKRVAVQNWSIAEINGGEINGYIWASVWSGEFPDSELTINESAVVNGTIKALVDKLYKPSEQYPDPVYPHIYIEGGTFDVNWDVENEDFVEVSGGAFTSPVDSKYLAEGHVCAGKDGQYIVAEKQENADVNISVEKPKTSFEEITNDQVEAGDIEDKVVTDTVETVKDNFKNNEEVQKKEAVTGLETAVKMDSLLGDSYQDVKTEVEVKMNIGFKNMTLEKAEAGTKVTQLVFEVHPSYRIRINDEEPTEDRTLDNEHLSGKTITFRLPIPSAVTEAYAKVTHQGDVDYYDIEGSGANQYIEVKATHFSEFVVEFTNSKPSSGSGSGGSSTIRNNGTWHQDNVGWWFAKTGGGYPADQWYECYWNGQMKWYHFNAQGYLDAGWFTDKDGATYYLHNQHDNQFGYMYTGWNWIDGKCYYFTPNTIAGGLKQGMLYKKGITPDGYSVNEAGAWTVNGTVQMK